ncbi:hypothetical protein PHYC_02137 [Phycisphaerales bacterium]|nr:hypothetical protein PHYC_02137 [Phycisphaerales bacterium]
MIPALLTAAWLGLLTSVSPCPLATNIAAVGYLGRHAARPRRALFSGICYVAGRTICYAILAAVLSMGLAAAAAASETLNRIVGLLVGPVLIITGGMMLGLIPAPAWSGAPPRIMERLGKSGDQLGAALLGALFALSFCPSSAALFFGGLLPLATKSESVVLVPITYGVATGLPVLVFASMLAGGGAGIGRLFVRVQQVERWLRLATGLVILGVGLYLAIRVNLTV